MAEYREDKRPFTPNPDDMFDVDLAAHLPDDWEMEVDGVKTTKADLLAADKGEMPVSTARRDWFRWIRRLRK